MDDKKKQIKLLLAKQYKDFLIWVSLSRYRYDWSKQGMPGRVWLMCIEKLMLQCFVCVVAKVIKKKSKSLILHLLFCKSICICGQHVDQHPKLNFYFLLILIQIN